MSSKVKHIKGSRALVFLMRPKSSLLFVFIFLIAFSFSIGVHGYVVDTILMCDDIDPVTSAHVGEGEVYLTYNSYAYCWVNFTDGHDLNVVRFDWYNPVGEIYETSTIDDAAGLNPVFGRLGITGNNPASNPGEWSVKVYVNNVLIDTAFFTIVDYDTVIEKTNMLESQIVDITVTFEQLLANVESVRDDYGELLIDYNELSDSYDDLSNDYTEQINDYNIIADEKNTLQEGYDDIKSDYDELALETNQLSEDYNNIVSEYESIDKQLGNTRNMMYGSVALAVIFLGVAIYFSKK